MAAGFDYRKDLITAVRAFENLKRRWNKPLQLVIAGDHRRLELGASSDLRTAVQESELRLNGDIFLPGIIAREDLPALYAGAEVLLCTSIYEGFGLSVLEAMACGTPVVVSDIQVFRELCGEAALYASTGNANSFADQVFRVLSDQRESEHLAETGLNRANQYSWEETARLTVEVYENAFSER
jgi:glycosyltransferase involved in cell wall biosynthesis